MSTIHRPRSRSLNPVSGAAVLGCDQGQRRDSPAAVVTVAAQGSLDAAGHLLHDGDPAAQLALAFTNVEVVLDEGGLDVTDLAQLRIYTTDLDALLDVLDTLVDHLAESGVRPPTTLVEVSRLPVPGMTLAIEALALR